MESRELIYLDACLQVCIDEEDSDDSDGYKPFLNPKSPASKI